MNNLGRIYISALFEMCHQLLLRNRIAESKGWLLLNLLGIAKFPLQKIVPVRRSNLPCALSIPASSCWVSQQCKALTALYLSHFSGLYCISPTLQDEVMSSSSQRESLLLFATKALNPVSPVFLFCNATHCVYRHPLSVPVSSLWDLRE